MLVQTLVQHAHRAWPMMSHVEVLPEPGEQAVVPHLDDLSIDSHGHTLPGEVEHDLRVLGLGQIIMTVAADGRPIAMADDDLPGTTAIAINAGSLTVCFSSRRLTGSFLTGRVGGAVTLDPNSAWTFELPWAEVERLDVLTRATGDSTEEVIVGLAIQGPIERPGPGALVFEPGNWMALTDRSTAPIEDKWTLIDEVAQLVARARGIEVPDYVQDDDGSYSATFAATA